MLEILDHLISLFFLVEMLVKIAAMGFTGKNTYLSDTWNRLDCFIVMAS